MMCIYIFGMILKYIDIFFDIEDKYLLIFFICWLVLCVCFFNNKKKLFYYLNKKWFEKVNRNIIINKIIFFYEKIV